MTPVDKLWWWNVSIESVYQCTMGPMLIGCRYAVCLLNPTKSKIKCCLTQIGHTANKFNLIRTVPFLWLFQSLFCRSIQILALLIALWVVSFAVCLSIDWRFRRPKPRSLSNSGCFLQIESDCNNKNSTRICHSWDRSNLVLTKWGLQSGGEQEEEDVVRFGFVGLLFDVVAGGVRRRKDCHKSLPPVKNNWRENINYCLY